MGTQGAHLPARCRGLWLEDSGSEGGQGGMQLALKGEARGQFCIAISKSTRRFWYCNTKLTFVFLLSKFMCRSAAEWALKEPICQLGCTGQWLGSEGGSGGLERRGESTRKSVFCIAISKSTRRFWYCNTKLTFVCSLWKFMCKFAAEWALKEPICQLLGSEGGLGGCQLAPKAEGKSRRKKPKAPALYCNIKIYA